MSGLKNILEEVTKRNKDKKIDFEGYLQEQHASQYVGAFTLMMEDFNEWLDELDIDEWIDFGDEFAQDLVNKEIDAQRNYWFESTLVERSLASLRRKMVYKKIELLKDRNTK